LGGIVTIQRRAARHIQSDDDGPDRGEIADCAAEYVTFANRPTPAGVAAKILAPVRDGAGVLSRNAPNKNAWRPAAGWPVPGRVGIRHLSSRPLHLALKRTGAWHILLARDNLATALGNVPWTGRSLNPRDDADNAT